MGRSSKTKVNKDYTDENIESAKEFLTIIDEAQKHYFRHSKKEFLEKKYLPLYKKLSEHNYKKLNNKTVEMFCDIYVNLSKKIINWNVNYTNRELISNEEIFSDIDGKSLDMQQREAIVVDEDNNLIVAGAGSGKTLTIAGKVKYLVQKKGIDPKDILLISFTKKSSLEMQERILQKLNIGVEAMTFHKLGLEILKKANARRADICDEWLLNTTIDNYFRNEIKKNKNALKDLITFMGLYINVPKDLSEFDCLGDLYDFQKSADLETIKSKVETSINNKKDEKMTIKGEKVRSIEEALIANFLYLNGVKYTYEIAYPYESDDIYRKKYRPDFYLDDYDIYIEHFGITEKYKTPWLSEIEEKKYIDGIYWKREQHKKNNTKLLETYSYYNKHGRLTVELDAILLKNGVKYHEVDIIEIFENLFNEQDSNQLKEFKKLIGTFLNLFKSNGYNNYDFDLLQNKKHYDNNEFFVERVHLFTGIVKPIYNKYQNKLKELDQIDFNDMINLATEIIDNEKLSIKAKYIIIDEFQDISVSRYKLIKAIKNKTNAIVMAVGDDWQSIYRFAGSDIDLFARFENYFGYSKLLKIERTYRNPQELIDIAGKYIMKNPRQLKKQLLSAKHDNQPIRMLGYNENIFAALKNAIAEVVELHGENTNIMVLGRNNFDIDKINNGEFEVKNSKLAEKSESVKVIYSKYPKLNMFFLSIHKSKGLEADNVILINLENKTVGFPNQIADDPILSLVMSDSDEYVHAEERRLFYVALTRTRNRVYLIVPDRSPSIFAQELIKDFDIKLNISNGETTITDNPLCPKCQKGYLIVRKNIITNSEFLGCTNYPQCDYNYKNINLLHSRIKCFKCGDYMIMRDGKNGKFYGCSNYPYCNNTIQFEMESIKYTLETEDDLLMVAETPSPNSDKPKIPATAKPNLVTESFGIKKPEMPKMPVVPQVQKPEVEDLDLSGVNVGVAITHKTFGAGTVSWIDKAQKHIRVTFTIGEKTFIFPDAFKQGFLKL